MPNGEWLTPAQVLERHRRSQSKAPVWLWLLLIALGGCTVTACVAAPHIGWTGWGVIILVWYFARKLDNLEAEVRSSRRN